MANNVPLKTWVFILDSLERTPQEEAFLQAHETFVIHGDEGRWGLSLSGKDFVSVGIKVVDNCHVPVPTEIKRIICIGCHDRAGMMYNRKNHELVYLLFCSASEWRSSDHYREEVLR